MKIDEGGMERVSRIVRAAQIVVILGRKTIVIHGPQSTEPLFRNE